MSDEVEVGEGPLPAGDISSWLAEFREALAGKRDSEVACGTCTACCRSSQFVHIHPDESDALGHIPAELLFDAPRLPPGHKVLGYDDRGHCPMLKDNQCSIYEFRPRTCRTYDCRVFSATGVTLRGSTTQDIARQSERWAFDIPTPGDRTALDAVKGAARYLSEHSHELERLLGSLSPTQLAVLAVELHEAFLEIAIPDGQLRLKVPDAHEVQIELERRRPPAKDRTQ
jgi:Fe-S-cluster containining protein